MSKSEVGTDQSSAQSLKKLRLCSTVEDFDEDMTTRPMFQMFRFKGTVIRTIWWRILLVTLYTSGVVALHIYKVIEFNFPLTLIPVLGVVTGLLLVFRTNTAYDRYYEGRKVWSAMTLNIRTLARCIWVMIKEREGSAEDIIDKISAINLLVAFVYASKNYLREMEDYTEEEKLLHPWLSSLPQFTTPNWVIPALELNKGQGEKPKKTRSSRQRRFTGSDDPPVKKNIPLELSFYIASYINKKENDVHRSVFAMMNTSLSNLIDCLGKFERIRDTPIPLAYSVHLQHCTWIYLLSLPYQLTSPLGWYAIPAVTLAAFALLGILYIGGEIEDPFGLDPNDLPLNRFCKNICTEIWRITGNQIESPDSWTLSEEVCPLSPVSDLSAVHLAKLDVVQIRQILASRVPVKMSPGRTTSQKQKTPSPKIVKSVTVSVIESDDDVGNITEKVKTTKA